VVAKVELKAVAPSACGLEPLDTHSALAQNPQPLSRQAVAPDFIVEKTNLHVRLCPRYQPIPKLHTQLVIMYDVKLHKDVIARRVDRSEDGVESCVTIHQQFDVIAARGRKRGQQLMPPSKVISRAEVGGEGPNAAAASSAAERSGPLSSVAARR